MRLLPTNSVAQGSTSFFMVNGRNLSRQNKKYMHVQPFFLDSLDGR